MLAHITYLSDESMSRKFGRELQDADSYSFDFQRDFAVESYLEHQGRRFVELFDANSYFYITRAMDYFDMARRSGGDLAKTFSAAKAAFLVVSFSSDWLFPTAESRKIVNALLKNRLNVSFCEIQSGYGHDAFLLEVDALGRMSATSCAIDWRCAVAKTTIPNSGTVRTSRSSRSWSNRVSACSTSAAVTAVF